MAVRAYTKEEFFLELSKAGFIPTETTTDHFTVWRDADNNYLSVNNSHDCYPYYYLNSLLECVGISYNSSGHKIESRAYEVSEK